MPRVGENVYKRSDKRWEARYAFRDASGIQKYKSFYGKTKSEAKLKRQQYIEQLQQRRQQGAPASVLSNALAIIKSLLKTLTEYYYLPEIEAIRSLSLDGKPKRAQVANLRYRIQNNKIIDEVGEVIIYIGYKGWSNTVSAAL